MPKYSEPERAVRRYSFGPPQYGLGYPEPAPYASPVLAVENYFDQGEPATLTVSELRRQPDVYPWRARDYAMMSLFAADVAVSVFETTGTGYRHPRHALRVAKNYIMNPEWASREDVRRKAKDLTRLAQRSSNSSRDDPELSAALWSAANTVRCAARLMPTGPVEGEGKSWVYAASSVNLAARVDPDFDDRFKHWIYLYVHRIAYLVPNSRWPEE